MGVLERGGSLWKKKKVSWQACNFSQLLDKTKNLHLLAPSGTWVQDEILQVQAQFLPRQQHDHPWELKPPQWGSMLAVASKWDQGNGHENMSIFPAYSLTTGRRKLSPSCHLHEDGRLDNTGLCFLWEDLTPLQKTKRRGHRFSSGTGWDKAAEQLGRVGEDHGRLQSRLEGWPQCSKEALMLKSWSWTG